jgi:group I intron endonuclease
MGFIYLVTNTINGKQYVGQTINFVVRKKKHEKNAVGGSMLAFHCAIRKYGTFSFLWEILCSKKLPSISEEKEWMDHWEKHYIAKLNTIAPNGYNLTVGGEGVLGLVFSDESRRKMSVSAVKRCLSPSWKAKSGASRRKLWEDPEFREKTTRAHIGKHLSQQAKDKVSKANKGKIVKPETGEKISQAKKRHWQDPEYRARVTATMKKHRSTEECRLAQQATTKRQWEKHRSKMLKSAASEETKAKKSRTMKSYWKKKREGLCFVEVCVPENDYQTKQKSKRFRSMETRIPIRNVRKYRRYSRLD